MYMCVNQINNVKVIVSGKATVGDKTVLAQLGQTHLFSTSPLPILSTTEVYFICLGFNSKKNIEYCIMAKKLE